MNYSKQRELIFDTLLRHPVHPSAEELFQILKKENPNENISIATVYRNLRKMANNGVIKCIRGLDEFEHFDSVMEHHYHFICDECKKIFDVEPLENSPVISKLQEETGCKVNFSYVIFHGICKNCRS